MVIYFKEHIVIFLEDVVLVKESFFFSVLIKENLFSREVISGRGIFGNLTCEKLEHYSYFVDFFI